jgi:hypothetical protein
VCDDKGHYNVIARNLPITKRESEVLIHPSITCGWVKGDGNGDAWKNSFGLSIWWSLNILRVTLKIQESE